MYNKEKTQIKNTFGGGMSENGTWHFFFPALAEFLVFFFKMQWTIHSTENSAQGNQNH